MKRIAQFGHSRKLSLAEAERHYLLVHTEFARRMFERHPDALRYYTNRAVGQYDINGAFHRRPDAWRFVITETGAAEAKDWLPSWAQETIWRDHTVFMRDLCSYQVTESAVLDRLGRQTALVKVLFRYAAGEATADYYAGTHLPTLSGLVAQAPGARLMLSNSVQAQLEVAPIEEPGQRYTGALVAQPDVTAFEEYYFDSRATALDFFARAQIRDLVLDYPGAVTGYWIAERCGLDRRPA